MDELKGRITSLAPYGRHISIKCKICGCRYHTKNISHIGARTIFMSGSGNCEHKASDFTVDTKNIK